MGKKGKEKKIARKNLKKSSSYLKKGVKGATKAK